MLAVIRNYIPWLLTTCISFILIFSNNLPQVEVLRAKISDTVVTLSSPISSLSRYGRLGGENRKLRKQISEVSLLVGELQSSGAECERLQRLLNYREESEFKLVAGVVIGLSPDPGVRGVIVNCGIEDGVEQNFGAISPQGVVGRVYRSGSSSAAVQLLTDQNIGIAGRTLNSRELGMVHAGKNGELKIDGIPVTANVEKGEKIVTAGLDGIFPNGLTIGHVKEIRSLEESWLLEVIVDPSVKFNQLEELFVVIRADSAE